MTETGGYTLTWVQKAAIEVAMALGMICAGVAGITAWALGAPGVAYGCLCILALIFMVAVTCLPLPRERAEP